MPSPEAEETLVKILTLLQGVRRQNAKQWTALCPSHGDETPSLSVGIGEENNILFHCHAGCTPAQVCEAVGLSLSDLMGKPLAPKPERTKHKFVESYTYNDSDGGLVYEVLRYLEPDGRKTFRVRRPDGAGGWIWSLGNIERPLYQLEKVTEAIVRGEMVYVVEGEKDVHTLMGLGFTATTASGGVNGWRESHTKALAGARVTVIADNDAPGIAHATAVYAALDGVAVERHLMRPADGFKDVSEIGEDPLGNLVSLPVPQGVEGPRAVRWDLFMSENTDDAYDWIIPDVLERQERVIIVAGEGVGKSTLSRQVAILSAAGLNPFIPQNRMPPIRTLMFDLENPERIIRRNARPIVERARHSLAGNLGEFPAILVPKPDGINLLQPRDQLLVERFCQEHRPDILFIGPLYKAFLDPGGQTAEAVATTVAKYLDYIRITFNTAIWVEHHAPLGVGESRYLRPFGSAVWSRWSEFGLAIYQDPTVAFTYEIRHYRGMRDVRRWPKTMRRGELFPFEVLDFYDM